MPEVTVRDLCARPDEVLDRVERGETVLIVRDGRAVGELRPVSRAPLSGSALLARWERVPVIDAAAFRSDIGAVLDDAWQPGPGRGR